MLDRFSNWVKETSSNLQSEVLKYKNKDFLEATVAACALVAAADGNITSEEKQKMIGFMKQSEALSVFDTGEVIKLFEKYTSNYDFDAMIGKAESLRTISKLKKNRNRLVF